MKNSMISSVNKIRIYCMLGALFLCALFFISLFIGKYPLSLNELINKNELQWKVFVSLRLSRALVGCIGGFVLGICGYIFQTIFKNPLASPEIVGVSSGASAGAAFGILFFSGTFLVTVSSFAGALMAVVLALLLSSFDKSGRKSTVILAGIAVHSFAQTVLMALKLMADPEKQLASIEYWIMGSLNGISIHSIGGNVIVSIICVIVLFLLYRQMVMMSLDEVEAKMLGVNVGRVRLILVIISTVAVSCIVSMTGLISFVGLIAPHCARKLTVNNERGTMLLSGFIGGCIFIGADMLARSVASSELPVSIFTSLIGVPFIIVLIIKERQKL